MKIDIVVYGPHGRAVLGRTDVPASAWVDGMPSHVWEQLSTGLFTEQLELVLHRKRTDATAKHMLRVSSFGYYFYEFKCEKCGKAVRFLKDSLKWLLTGTGPRQIMAWSTYQESLGGCKVLSPLEVS